MYEKMLYGRKVLYFRHAPPITGLDDASARDTKLPYADAPGYKCSVFYYWWAFLKESKPYILCCDNGGLGQLSDLYYYFGDVRGSDFMHWWRFGGFEKRRNDHSYSGRMLFCEPPKSRIKAVVDINNEGDVGDGSILLRVPVTNDLSRLTAEFKRLMLPLVAERIRDYGEPKGQPLFDVTSPNPSLKVSEAPTPPCAGEA